MLKTKKAIAKLNPLECTLCGHKDICLYGVQHEELYRKGVSIRFNDCANYNGGHVLGAKAVPNA